MGNQKIIATQDGLSETEFLNCLLLHKPVTEHLGHRLNLDSLGPKL